MREPAKSTPAEWRELGSLMPGDRIEVGFAVFRVVDTLLLPNHLRCVRERDGETYEVRHTGDAYHTPDGRALVRYVGPPGSDPERREYWQEKPGAVFV